MELTTDNLEYIIYVAKDYCYLNKKQIENCGEEVIKTTQEVAVDIAILTFKHRYPIIEEQYRDKHEMFISNPEIQDTLVIYNLNPDKFWLLFLFVTDFMNSCFSHRIEAPQAVNEVASEMLDTLETSIEHCDTAIDGYSNMDNAQLTLSTNTNSISTTNPLFLALFKEFCSMLVKSEDNNLFRVPCEFIELMEDKVRTKKMRFFVELFRHFLDAHIKVVKPSRMTFIGKFLYLANIAEQEWFYTGFFPTPINKKNQYMIKLFGTMTMDGTEYIKEPIDVGKKIADTIKKCDFQEPTELSNYVYIPC